MTEKFQIPDIYQLEMTLKEKIHELQWKTDALDKINIDLNQNRQMLYDERMLLNQERRRVKELDLQLKNSCEIIELLEKNKIKYQQEKIQLQVKCETAAKERDSLLNQARDAKVENIMLMSKIQHLEEEISKKEAFGKAVQPTLEQIKDEMTKMTHSLQRNISKLEQEQEYFRQSIKDITKFNQRLVVLGKCAHIEHQQQSKTIKDLQTRLNKVSIKETEKLQEMESIIDLPKIQASLDETNKSDSDEDLDRQVEAFIEEIKNADGE